jgi:hypothetical protein
MHVCGCVGEAEGRESRGAAVEMVGKGEDRGVAARSGC